MRLVALLLLVGGCDGVFGLVHVHEAASDAHGSGRDAARDASLDAPVDGGLRSGDALDAFVDIGCPVTYSITTAYGRYRFVATARTWLAAQNDCLDDTPAGNSKHTHLAVSSSDAETTSLAVDVAGSSGDFWVGLSDQVTKFQFQWVTDEPITYPPASGYPWDTNQPSKGTGEDCVVERGSPRAFDDTSCGLAFNYVCECDDYTDVAPANY